MKRIHLSVLVSVVGCLAASAASAEVFCTNTVNEIHLALTEAGTNGQNDEIRIVAGTYGLTNGLGFSSEQTDSLSIRGGYNSNCTVFTGATTTLDGQDKERPLFINIPNGNSSVEDLTFVNGLSTNNRGGGLRILSHSGDIRVDHNIFYANRADDFGGALTASTADGSLLIRNNLAFGNSSANIGAFEFNQTTGNAYIVGNTIFANISEGDFLPGGMHISGPATFTVSNNIIWGNVPEDAGPFISDFQSTAGSHSRYSNDIGVIGSGTVAAVVADELSVDPEFITCGFFCVSFELKRSSPLVDAGDDSPPGGMTQEDLAGKDRTIGAHVDIGAYENDRLFADGFDDD
ncbi:MAG: choice-of-anchor Q domain-containing protein [Rhodanobacteraceae bacterium]